MIPLLRPDQQPPICAEYAAFKTAQIRNIMIAKTKKAKERRLALNCAINEPLYKLVGILHFKIMIETRMLGRCGTEKIEKEIEDLIWKHQSAKSIRPNATVQGIDRF